MRDKDIDKLPSCKMYARLLDKVVSTMNLTIDEARNRYGLFTIRQWSTLLDAKEKYKNCKTNVAMVELQKIIEANF